MKSEKISGIYCIENKKNGKKYIGCSTNIENRWESHTLESSNPLNKKRLYKDFKKYGIGNFSFYVLEECNENEFAEREDFYIEMYQTRNPEYGYNTRKGFYVKRYRTLSLHYKD